MYVNNLITVVKANPKDFYRYIHKELAPILVIFQRSIDQAKLPSIWKEANVSPIFQKGDKTEPANYHPISLACVLCKVLEHILASNISKHCLHKPKYSLQPAAWVPRGAVLQDPADHVN